MARIPRVKTKEWDQYNSDVGDWVSECGDALTAALDNCSL